MDGDTIENCGNQSGKDWKQKVMKLLVLDLPGFGGEPLVANDWDIPDYTNWLRSKIETQILAKDEDSKVILAGHSFGGKISNLLAAQGPAWLEKLILIGTPALRRPSLKLKTRIFYYKTFKHLIPKSLRSKFYAEELKDALRDEMEKIFKNSVEFDATQQLPQIAVPTLIIWGDDDQAVSGRVTHEMHQLIPNSELKVIKGAGHNLHIKQPQLLVGLIDRFAK